MENRPSKLTVPKTGLVVVFGLACMLFSTASWAQDSQVTHPISLDDAISKAQEKYPLIQKARLEIDKQTVLKQQAWDMGNTQVFTGGEELKDGLGVYTTIGIQQQQMDVFGIPSKTKYQEQQIVLAEAALDLSSAGLAKEVGIAFAKAYTAQLRYSLLEKMDSLYSNFERAARIRYETETTSKLEWLSAQNKSKQVTIQMEQSRHDYQIALQRFNLWLVSDTLFTVDVGNQNDMLRLGDSPVSKEDHPLLLVAKEQRELAEKGVKKARAGYLPKLYAQYGIQEVQGNSGYSAFQLGISIPLAFHQNQADVRSAKLEAAQAKATVDQQRREFNTAHGTAWQKYLKWKGAYEFYEAEALPLANEQERGAMLAYKEGAIDYVAFLQNINDALQIEKDALETLQAYFISKIELEYFNRPNRNQNEQ
nr:TolC family protein [Echinicola strongylocentroti]